MRVCLSCEKLLSLLESLGTFSNEDGDDVDDSKEQL